MKALKQTVERMKQKSFENVSLSFGLKLKATFSEWKNATISKLLGEVGSNLMS